MDNDDIKKTIKGMKQPLKEIPFSLVIDSISNCKVIQLNLDDARDRLLLEDLKTVAMIAGTNANICGIRRKRPNEVGNDIEPYVINALVDIGYQAHRPTTSKGSEKAAGYPDIEIEDKYGRVVYLECKTFNIENISTTQRTFYLSPSDDFKVTKDAYHIALSYEIYVESSDSGYNLYKCKSWKIIALENLVVDLKYEFNADNVRLYSQDAIIAEDKLV